MTIEAIRWHDPGSVFDGFASPGPERPSGSWIHLVTRCHDRHMKQHIQSYLQSIHHYPYMYTPCPFVHTSSFEGPDVSCRFRAPMRKTTSCTGTRPKSREGPWQSCGHLTFCFAAHSSLGRSVDVGRPFLYASFGCDVPRLFLFYILLAAYPGSFDSGTVYVVRALLWQTTNRRNTTRTRQNVPRILCLYIFNTLSRFKFKTVQFGRGY